MKNIALILSLTTALASSQALAEGTSGEDSGNSESIRPSFDCSADLTPIEKTICGDENLSKLDFGMNERFHEWKDFLISEGMRFPHALEDLEESQNRWLQLRDSCSADDTGCIDFSYSEREFELLQTRVLIHDESQNDLQKPGDFRVYDYLLPCLVRSVYVPKEMLASPLISLESAILESAIVENSEHIDQIEACSSGEEVRKTTYKMIKMSENMIAIEQRDYSYTGGNKGDSNSTIWWVDVKQDKKLQFTDLFLPENYSALSAAFSEQVVTAAHQHEESSDEKFDWEILNENFEKVRVSSLNSLDISLAEPSGGEPYSLILTDADGEYSPFIGSELTLPIEPFLPLMKPEYREAFE